MTWVLALVARRSPDTGWVLAPVTLRRPLARVVQTLRSEVPDGFELRLLEGDE